MDIYYMSDSIQYSSFRGPVYRDYEKFPYGTLENPLNNPVSKTKQQQQQRRHHSSSSGSTSAQAKLLSYIGKSSSTGGSKSSKDSCPFCKEQKKRPLGAYMRKRGQRITTESISEDAEECNEEELREEDEEEDVCASNRGTTLSTSPSGDHHQHMHRGITGVPGFNRQESIEGK
ncbi:uncharacterized protein LOC4578351 [Anopheles gambiae]|uniref:Uncharacterized protein n=2 Tax=gambiae species complex TaxID=44542 RepID=A0A6E8VU61_ANOCL|nr:uncharacterized protein LOC120954879 [Anopheles coluzzii]XP_061516337.1 uncharacterized protein LOC4578351 [Anopheles gambiae]